TLFRSSPLWNLVMRGGSIGGTEPYDGIICPTCFMILAGDTAELWRLDAQRVRGVMETELADGRRWNSATWLWADAAPADPAGLDAAIAAARHSVRIEGRWPFEVPDHVLKPAVRAAAPHLRAAALN